MDERSDMEEVVLPGFRFQPTDEELVGFYLKRKVQQKPIYIELIRQLNIYKHDPWELPKLAASDEKEWYFYCPRDRKYRNSARPNRVTGGGFWKATGTDRPIYSSEGTKCIGLKKSLVFYKGRAAKGVKTDWMMHEFRLPSAADTALSSRPIEMNVPINDSWAICKIFKKTSSMAQRALSRSWVSPLPETATAQALDPDQHDKSCNIFVINVDSTSSLDIPGTGNIMPNSCFMFSGPGDASMLSSKPSTSNVAEMLPNLPPTIFEDANCRSTSTSIHFEQQHRLQQYCRNSFETSGDLSVVGREIICSRRNNSGSSATTGRQPNVDDARITTTTSMGANNKWPGVSDAWMCDATAVVWNSLPCPSGPSASYPSKFVAFD